MLNKNAFFVTIISVFLYFGAIRAQQSNYLVDTLILDENGFNWKIYNENDSTLRYLFQGIDTSQLINDAKKIQVNSFGAYFFNNKEIKDVAQFKLISNENSINRISKNTHKTSGDLFYEFEKIYFKPENYLSEFDYNLFNELKNDFSYLYYSFLAIDKNPKTIYVDGDTPRWGFSFEKNNNIYTVEIKINSKKINKSKNTVTNVNYSTIVTIWQQKIKD